MSEIMTVRDVLINWDSDLGVQDRELIVILSQGDSLSKIAGGADVYSINLAKALHKLGYNVIYLRLCLDCNKINIIRLPYIQMEIPSKTSAYMFLSFMLKDNVELLRDVLVKILDYRKIKHIIVITLDIKSLYYSLSIKNISLFKDKIMVIWRPGGNDFTCPLHTEACPFSNSYTKTYGHQYTYPFFITKCLPHIIQTRELTPYHIIVWPYLRNKIIDNIDGILASRSVYIEGCKYLNFNKCFYVGFGIDTEIFKPRNKIEVIKSILNDNDYLQVIKNAQVFGDFYGLVNDILSYHDVTVIGYIGSTEPWWKNTTLLLNTFKNIAKSNDNIKLLIISRHTKSLLPFLRNIPKDIIDRITIIERIPHKYIPLLYNLFDIFINPSLLDSLENNTLEALASGNITLASKKGCINDLRHLGISSIITFDPDEYSLSSTLEVVLSDINSYRDRALREIQQIHKQLSIEAFGRRLIDAINFIKERRQQGV